MVDVHEMGYNFHFSQQSHGMNILRSTRRIFTILGAKWPRSLMLKTGYITPENDLICFILVMGYLSNYSSWNDI
jgi:hypothetical protein